MNHSCDNSQQVISTNTNTVHVTLIKVLHFVGELNIFYKISIPIDFLF